MIDVTEEINAVDAGRHAARWRPARRARSRSRASTTPRSRTSGTPAPTRSGSRAGSCPSPATCGSAAATSSRATPAGTIERCDPPHGFDATWEYGGRRQLDRAAARRRRARAAPASRSSTSPTSTTRAGRSSAPAPSASAGTSASSGLSLHLATGSRRPPRAGGGRRLASLRRRARLRHALSSDGWAEASVAAGTDPAQARDGGRADDRGLHRRSPPHDLTVTPMGCWRRADRPAGARCGACRGGRTPRPRDRRPWRARRGRGAAGLWASRRCWSARGAGPRAAEWACCGRAGTSSSGRSGGAPRGRCWRLRCDRSELERAELTGRPAAARVLFERGERAADVPPRRRRSRSCMRCIGSWCAWASAAPLLLVVDDGQWVDEPSLRFLVYLLGRLSDQPIAVVVAARAGERGEGGLLERLAGDPAARALVLAPLGAAAVVAAGAALGLPGVGDGVLPALLRADGRQPAAGARAAGGDRAAGRRPAGEAALAAAAELAARSLRALGAAAAGPLSPDARALARAVAVLEDDAPLALAAELAHARRPRRRMGAADELAQADVLRAGDPVGFTHPLVRAAVYGQLAFGERAQIAPARGAVAGGNGRAGRAGQRRTARITGLPATRRWWMCCAARPPARVRAGRAGVRGGLPGARAARAADGERAPRRAGRARARGGGRRAGRRRWRTSRPRSRWSPSRRERAALRLELGRASARPWPADRGQRVLPARARRARRGAEATSELAARPRGRLSRRRRCSTPELAADAHRRVGRRSRRADELIDSRAGRALASKAMIMRLFGRRARATEVLAVAHRLLADGRLIEEDGADSQARTHVIGCLSWCDDYEAAERRAAALVRRRAAPRIGADVRDGLAAARPPAAVDRARSPTPSRTPAPPTSSGARGGRCTCTRRATAWSSGLLEQGEPTRQAAGAGARRSPAGTPRASSRRGATPRSGGWPPIAANRRRAWTRSSRSGGGSRELLAVNPTVLPWRSEAGLAAQRLGDHELARDADRRGARARRALRRSARDRRRAPRRGLLERGEAAVERLRSAGEPLAACGARVEQARALIDLGAAIRRAGRPGRGARDAARRARARRGAPARERSATCARGAAARGRASARGRGRARRTHRPASAAWPSSRPPARATGRSPTRCSSPSSRSSGTWATSTASSTSAAAASSPPRSARPASCLNPGGRDRGSPQ